MGEQLQSEITVLDDTLRTSEEDIAKLQTKLREARHRQNSIMTRLASATNRVRMREVYAGPQTQDAFSRLRSEEHTYELRSLLRNPSAAFCLKKKNAGPPNLTNTRVNYHLHRQSL